MLFGRIAAYPECERQSRVRRGIHPNSQANLIRFTATNQPKNPGRKPSKLRKFLIENNVSREDASVIVRNMLFNYTKEQLEKLENDEKKLLIIRSFARAFLADWDHGTLQNLQTFMLWAYGTPKTEVTVTGGLDITVLSPQDRHARIKELLSALEFDRQPAVLVEQVDTPE